MAVVAVTAVAALEYVRVMAGYHPRMMVRVLGGEEDE